MLIVMAVLRWRLLCLGVCMVVIKVNIVALLLLTTTTTTTSITTTTSSTTITSTTFTIALLKL